MPYRAGERRRKLAAAVLGRDPGPAPRSPEETEPFDVVSGDILDVSPHLIILETADGEQRRLVIAPWATAWRGGAVAPADLPAGARVVVRALRGGTVAERIWADITRITGVIREVGGRRDLTVELDCGPHRRERSIVVPYRSSGRIRVRHPKLEPGYLFDAIGLLDQGTSFAHLPATSQPPYRAAAVPPPSVAYGGGDAAGVSGSAVWADLADLPDLPDLPDLAGLAEGGITEGVAYPMLEREDTGCDDAGVSCAGLPYLALGSLLRVRNVCDGRANTLPIVACGCLAGRFCDRCLECGTSPRGRIVELAACSYVALGGDLTKGCFNARVGLG
ncbi:hypothetical protein [Microbispora bryophytorum]|uniref:Uncharacterized protein n=1 Tax=Microbispora bryophytorum TaxID=1460882 RepID=A0A8H9GUH1_9ACTN|nr:hypothetical protein [Microbispora bryophytorum]MBD3138786.1 hypothetical protein [Microbispora bryophytorum]TQS10058.1 hypothetical protein FLX07_03230 [Microbispora bryophytorum]GGO00205.1 hypothetical protein GCM10011574_06660 [Microbispora bryophytorum]